MPQAASQPAGPRTEPSYSIGQLSREFGVSARALRFYEDRGLLAPARQGLSRVYGQRERARVQLIVRGKRVGFALDEIREILDLYDRSDGGAAQMAASLDKFRARIAALKLQRGEIDRSIEALEEGCVWLAARLAEVRPGEAASRRRGPAG